MIGKKLFTLTVLLILLTTVAYSGLATSLAITGEATFRAVSDIRVTDISFNNAQDATQAYSSTHTKDTITSGFVLSNQESEISYNVTITNNGDIDQAIYDLQILSSNNNDMTVLIDDNPINDSLPMIVPFKTNKTIKVTYKTNSPSENIINIVNIFVFKEVYYVEYNSMGGSKVETQIKYKNVDLVLQGTPTKENNSFLGWTDDEDEKIVKYNEGDTYTLNEDIILYALYNPEYAMFIPGEDFNTKIKTLANPTLSNITYQTADTNIISIQRATSLPSSWIDEDEEITPPSNDNIVSTNDSDHPIYAWYDNGTIYYYTEVEHPYMNINANSMFKGLNSVISIDLVSIDTSKTTNMSSLFSGCQSLSSINLSNFDTSNVESMNSTFENCSSLSSLDLSSLDMISVVDTTDMLTNTTSLNQIKTPKTYTYDETISISLPSVMYDSSNSPYISLTSGDPIKIWLKRPYTVIYNSNGGTGTMNNQMIGVDATTKLLENTFTRNGYIFVGWNTKEDGTGTPYLNNVSVTNLASYGETVNLYAQWTANGVAMVGNTVFSSLQNAINSVSTNGEQTEVILLKNVSETIETKTGQNIVLNLQNFTLSNNGSTNVIKNYGTLTINSGKITSNISQGIINNYGKLYVTGGTIEATTTSTRQAIYNDGGEVEISGNAVLSSKSTSRATIQNKKSGTSNVYGTVKITGGTILSTGYYAIQNDGGTITLGEKDGIYHSTPDIQGLTYGIYLVSTNNVIVNFYDGIIKGKTAPIADLVKLRNKIGAFDKEDLYNLEEETIKIDDVNYKKAFLEKNLVITLNPMGGEVTPSSIGMKTGEMIGTLPKPTRTDYVFDGWFTEDDVEVTSESIFESDCELFAHWISSEEYFVASIGSTKYQSLAVAISAVPNNTQTTINLLRNASEVVTIPTNKNIILNGHNYTLSNIDNTATNVPVINNTGTLTIISGTIKTESLTTAALNNTGTLYVTGGNIKSIGQRQAIYNNGGTLEISGTAYLSATTPVRATIHNLANEQTKKPGVVIIKGGTIVSHNYSAVYNAAGSITIGIKDSIIDTNSPILQGAIYAIDVDSEKTTLFNFYDGTLKGVEDCINGLVPELEIDSQLNVGEETIDNVIYKTVNLISSN